VRKRILVQAGHVAPREPGFEGGTGTAGEQELVTQIRNRLCVLLQNDGRFEPIPVPGDIPNGVKVDAALFLHADGSGDPRSSGFSFGYPSAYAVNRRLADLVAHELMGLPGHPPHHRDNYTRDEGGYYGFSRVDTPGPELLVEHGFLTNPTERAWLRINTGQLALAEYHALCRYFGYPPNVPKPPAPKRKTWTFVIVGRDGKIRRGTTRYPTLTTSRARSSARSIDLDLIT
jgi:N-acetylmuramoyl-L-alanine amidase